MANPLNSHRSTIKMILLYLCGTIYFGFSLMPDIDDKKLSLMAYSDSD